MFRLLVVLFFCFSLLSFSQENEEIIKLDSIASLDSNLTIIRVDTIRVSDSPKNKTTITNKDIITNNVTKAKNTSSNNFIKSKPIESTNVQTKKSSEIIINKDLTLISDDEFAKQIDDLWFNSMKNSSLNIEDNLLVDISNSELSTEVLKERLAYLNTKTPFNVEYNEQLERIIKSFLKNRKEKYADLLAKSKYYFPLIEEQLDKYNIPLEMKYLVVIESALNPLARSRVGATGLWQFMYQTGKQFDLKTSSYIDERNDVLKATIAACKFLNQLYATFNDWDLALAAYNSGPGNVSKAIRRSGGARNYWNIRHHLPRETASYVPLFYTTMYIFEYADKHQITPTETIIQHFETDTIQVQKQITFDQITKAIPIEKNMLLFLNPQYKLEIIPVVKGRNYSLTLPKNLIGQFVQNEDRIYAFAEADNAKREKPLPKYTEANNKIRYRVRSGDFLGKIAKKFGVSVSKIMRWNSLRSSNLSIGQRLTIYPRR